MITIRNGKLNIPEFERFIGFAGDNLNRTIEFLVSGATEADRIYRIYLTFDDGTCNYFVLPSEVTDKGVLITWNVELQHIFKSGIVKAQIKAFSNSGAVYHTTSDTFIVGDSAELTESFLKENSEFLEHEKHLNDLYESVSEICVMTPYIGDNGNWYVYNSDTGEYMDSGKPSMGSLQNTDIEDKAVTTVKLADKAVTTEKIADKAIDSIDKFTPEMVAEYFSIPVVQKKASYGFSDTDYNSLTTPGVYRMDAPIGTHEVLIVLKPDSNSYLMQFRINYNKVEFRGLLATDDGVYADEDWEDWIDLTAEKSITLDKELDENSANGVENKAVAKAVNEIRDTLITTRTSSDSTKTLNTTSLFENSSLSDSSTLKSEEFLLRSSNSTLPLNVRIPVSDIVKFIKKITDTGDYFTAEDVDGALQEIGATLASLNAYDAVKMNTKQTALSAECNRLLANIKENYILSASSSIWDDMPTTSGCVFINWQYGTNYNLQLVFVQSTGVMWRRIVDRRNGSVYNDWKQPDGTPLMKILSLGDSICSGARNNGKGFVGDLGFPYKNIGVSCATISNVTTTVVNIPDQLVNLNTSDPDYMPDVIIAEGGINDYSRGAALGTMSAVPVSTQTEAEALDRSTVVGALEYLLYKMITLYPKAQRFFLITHKTWKANINAYCPTTPNTAGWTQQDLHDAIVKCCNAYNVKVIDIYNDSMINSLFSEYRSETAYNDDNSVTNTKYVDYDGVHPLAYGYKEGYVPIIKNAIGIGTVKQGA